MMQPFKLSFAKSLPKQKKMFSNFLIYFVYNVKATKPNMHQTH